jgi:hypothetical protein
MFKGYMPLAFFNKFLARHRAGCASSLNMKMRIQDNALRLRLNRREVSEFEEHGIVSASIQFGSSALTYTLERGSVSGMEASFTGQEVRVRVPEATAREWTDTDRVGMETVQGTLEIVVEKDFQCMHKGEEAKDPDAYPNPLAAA